MSFDSLQESEDVSDNLSEEMLTQSFNSERLAQFISEQFVSLPAKLEVPASTLFYQCGRVKID